MPDNLINHLNTLTPKLTIFLFYITLSDSRQFYSRRESSQKAKCYQYNY